MRLRPTEARLLPRTRGVHRVLGAAGVVALLLVLPMGIESADAQQPGGAVARLSVSPATGPIDKEFEATARLSVGSMREDGQTRYPIVLYEWDWEGDGEFVAGAAREFHTFSEEGTHVVTVRVTDEVGATGTASRTITVGEPRTGMRWEIVTDNLDLFARGAQITLQISVISILAGIPLGIFFGLMRISKIAPLRWLAGVYIEFLRGTPLLVQIFIVVFALPEIGIRLSAVVGATVALTINTSAYQAEIIRSGIQAIPSGQMEAAVAMGLTYPQAMMDVILPQALRLVIPPMTNEFIILIKDSSLVSTIGVLELMGWARVLGNRSFRLFEPLIAVALIYFVMTYSLSLFLQWAERKLAIPGLGVPTAGGH